MEDAQREEREREYWSAFQVFAYEIKKNERNIEEWKQLIGSTAFSVDYYAGLIKDAEMRIAHLRQRIAELDSQPGDENEIGTP